MLVATQVIYLNEYILMSTLDLKTMVHKKLVSKVFVLPKLKNDEWVNTYRYIFSGMNIHLPAILGFTRYQGFDPSPNDEWILMVIIWDFVPRIAPFLKQNRDAEVAPDGSKQWHHRLPVAKARPDESQAGWTSPKAKP